MNPWIAKALVLAGTAVMIAIRAPHGQRNRSVKVAASYKTRLETGLLILAWIGFLVPLIWVASPAFSFAEFPLFTGPLVTGVMCLAVGLWLFYRSHADLGTNWSITLELREQHHLITQGVYRRIRHPMYLALALYSVGQALIIPNWVAGPSNLVAFAILFALRIRAEERMMVERFGAEYAAYRCGRSVSFLACGKKHQPADGCSKAARGASATLHTGRPSSSAIGRRRPAGAAWPRLSRIAPDPRAQLLLFLAWPAARSPIEPARRQSVDGAFNSSMFETSISGDTLMAVGR